MRIIFIISVFTLSCHSHSQTLHFEENFDYTTGELIAVSADWLAAPSGSVAIQVVDGNLSYSGYLSSSIGRMIRLDGGASGRQGVVRDFTATTGDGNSVYAAFLLNVTSTTDMDINTSDGDYFINFNGTQIKNRIVVRQGSDSTKYSIGIAKTTSASSIVWFGAELDIDTTYLIVMSYKFLAGSSNDEVRLWVNPPLTGTEPTPNILISSGADADTLSQIQLRQNPKSGDMQIDGLRISDNWEQAPLPVELISFYSTISGNSVTLHWRTETEINNYGFNVERMTPDNNKWKTIGFVEGNGFSYVPQDYTFTDKDVSAEGIYRYRLKQIDNDGSFEYSDIIDVYFSVAKEFILEQNYPNPFNPSTNISFSIPQDGQVVLKIFDLTGQEVETLINEYRKAGQYTLTWDASTLISGVYFYKLIAGDFTKVKKMILIR